MGDRNNIKMIIKETSGPYRQNDGISLNRNTVIFIHVNMILFNKQKFIVIHISKK